MSPSVYQRIPSSIRAIYGLDIMRNGLHASSNNKQVREEIALVFPDYEFIKHRPTFINSNEPIRIDTKQVHVSLADTIHSNDSPSYDVSTSTRLNHPLHDAYCLESDGRNCSIDEQYCTC
jgi:hypothetical protein